MNPYYENYNLYILYKEMFKQTLGFSFDDKQNVKDFNLRVFELDAKEILVLDEHKYVKSKLLKYVTYRNFNAMCDYKTGKVFKNRYTGSEDVFDIFEYLDDILKEKNTNIWEIIRNG